MLPRIQAAHEAWIYGPRPFILQGKSRKDDYCLTGLDDAEVGASFSRVLLVDDHPLVLEALEARLAKTSDLTVIGRASSGEEALEQVRCLLPDVVVMDINMPGMGGLEAVRQLKRDFPTIPVVVLTASESKEFLVQAVLAGAAGYVTKGCPPGLVMGALRTVLSGGATVPSELLRESIQELQRGHRRDAAPSPDLSEPLTEREEEVLQLVAEGLSNKEIGDTLHIVEATAKKHLHNILRKLGVSDRTQVAVTAIRMGLVRLTE